MSPPTIASTVEEAAPVSAPRKVSDQSSSTSKNSITIELKTPKKADGLELLPEASRARLEKYNIDLTHGYPEFNQQAANLFIDEGYNIRGEHWEYIERGKNADPEKKALFGAAKEVRDLTKYIGTEIVGLQLSELTNQQRDELALLIAERTVVFFRDQDLSPQKQRELGEYFGKVEVHPKAPHVPGLPGISVIWSRFFQLISPQKPSFRHPFGSASWHTDLTHELQPAGISHLHNDAIPDVGGDTLWVSGYGAYDKLSPALQQFLDGKTGIFRSMHPYIDRENPLAGPKFIEREHPIVRTHPATGWKALFVNRQFTTRIVGLEPNESDAILKLLFDVYESNLDLQVRFNWKPTKKGLGTSALWDNRISQHHAVWDYGDESGPENGRHGTRVVSLAETPFFDPKSKSQREALGLPNPL